MFVKWPESALQTLRRYLGREFRSNGPEPFGIELRAERHIEGLTGHAPVKFENPTGQQSESSDETRSKNCVRIRAVAPQMMCVPH